MAKRQASTSQRSSKKKKKHVAATHHPHESHTTKRKARSSRSTTKKHKSGSRNSGYHATISKAEIKVAGRLKPTPRKWPRGTIVSSRTVNLDHLKELYNGSLPDIEGRKHKYPPPSDEKAWRTLYAAALTHRNKERVCQMMHARPPVDKDKYKYEYLLFHGRPDQISDRSARNRDRLLNGLDKGDTQVVHHTDKHDMITEKTVKLTRCQHMRMHGKLCESDKMKLTKNKQGRDILLRWMKGNKTVLTPEVIRKFRLS